MPALVQNFRNRSHWVRRQPPKPSVTLRVLFVFIVFGTPSSRGTALNVTEHPSATWTSQQIIEAFADRDAPKYLIRDRDSVYGNEVRLRISSMGIEEVLTAPRSPWQNPYAERLIGSIRRDCLNHFIILNARHLKRALASYFDYYHGSGSIWDSTSNVHSLGGSRVSARLSQSRSSAVFITVMNALQRNDMAADSVLANDRMADPGRVHTSKRAAVHHQQRLRYQRRRQPD